MNSHITYQLTHILCEYGLLTIEQADLAQQKAREQHMPLISCLVRHQFISSSQIFSLCKLHFKMPVADLSTYDPEIIHCGIIQPALIDRYHMLPLVKDKGTLKVAVSDPTDHDAMSAIEFHTGLRIIPLLAAEHELDKIIQTHCRSNIIYAD